MGASKDAYLKALTQVRRDGIEGGTVGASKDAYLKALTQVRRDGIVSSCKQTITHTTSFSQGWSRACGSAIQTSNNFTQCIPRKLLHSWNSKRRLGVAALME